MKRSNHIGTYFYCPHCQKILTLNPKTIFTANCRYIFTCPHCNKKTSIKRISTTIYKIIEPIKGMTFKPITFTPTS